MKGKLIFIALVVILLISTLIIARETKELQDSFIKQIMKNVPSNLKNDLNKPLDQESAKQLFVKRINELNN